MPNKIYTTAQGDTWDIVARKVYGAEKRADILMAANYAHLDVFVFNAGVVIVVPDMPAESGLADNLPAWRKRA